VRHHDTGQALVGDSSTFFCVWPERGRHTARLTITPESTPFFFPGFEFDRRLARERCAA